jgi:hypothetical protein
MQLHIQRIQLNNSSGEKPPSSLGQIILKTRKQISMVMTWPRLLKKSEHAPRKL